MVLLDGISIKNYRCFGAEAAILPDLGKINLIIGQNNSGKSNILRFIVKHARLFEEGSSTQRVDLPPLELTDLPQNCEAENVEFGIQVRIESYLERFSEVVDGHYRREGMANAIAADVFREDDSLWFTKRLGVGDGYDVASFADDVFLEQNKLGEEEIGGMFRNAGDKGGQRNLGVLFTAMRVWGMLDLKIDLIPSLRSIRSINFEGLAIKDGKPMLQGLPHHSGSELVDELFKMQSPKIGDEADEDLLRNIEELLEDVLVKQAVKIKVTHDKSAIRVDMDGKRLPLEALGSGIEEVLIIATKASRFENQIVCIEEPELHLHPVLQRKLLHFLYEKTSNQYFIATHSAHLMDEEMCSVYHVTNDGQFSYVYPAVTTQHRSTVCRDLGYHASDILQANSIVWVEGPSDRIYLLHWIQALAPDLKEGLHFSIMFYGGRLLSHLMAADEEISDFIDLTRLNQNSLIVMDSDRSKKGERIGKTKQRVRSEFEDHDRFCWVTEGREIENYLSKELWEDAIAESHPKWTKRMKYGQYESIVSYTRSAKKTYLDKIKLARAATSKDPDFDTLDLKRQLDRLIKAIREANPEQSTDASGNQAS